MRTKSLLLMFLVGINLLYSQDHDSGHDSGTHMLYGLEAQDILARAISSRDYAEADLFFKEHQCNLQHLHGPWESDILIWACIEDVDSALVKFLLDHGMDPQVTWSSAIGKHIPLTPLLATQLRISESKGRALAEEQHQREMERLAQFPHSHFMTDSTESELITRYLIQAGARIEVKLPNNHAVQELLEEKLPLNEISALELALYSGRYKNVALLLDAGALKVPTEMPILVFAIKYGNSAMTEPADHLVHQTPVHVKLSQVDLLLAAGADPNEEGPDGVTPLMAAAELGSLIIMTRLVSYGARYDERALRIAQEKKHVHVAAYLEGFKRKVEGRPYLRETASLIGGLALVVGVGVLGLLLWHYDKLLDKQHRE